MRGGVQRTRALKYEELLFNNVAVVSHCTNPSGVSSPRYRWPWS